MFTCTLSSIYTPHQKGLRLSPTLSPSQQPEQRLVSTRPLTAKVESNSFGLKHKEYLFLHRCSKTEMPQGWLFSVPVAGSTTGFFLPFCSVIFSVFPFTLQTTSSCTCKMAAGLPGIILRYNNNVKEKGLFLCAVFFS